MHAACTGRGLDSEAQAMKTTPEIKGLRRRTAAAQDVELNNVISSTMLRVVGSRRRFGMLTQALLMGAASAFDPFALVEPPHVSRRDPRDDARRLSSDARRIEGDFVAAVTRETSLRRGT